MVDKTAVIFVGQGTQYRGMCNVLDNPVAREVYKISTEILGRRKSGLAFNRYGQIIGIRDVRYSNLAIYVNNQAFYMSLMDRVPELKPKVVTGHSAGLFNAVVASGAVPYERGLAIIDQMSQFTHQEAKKIGGTLMIVKTKNYDLKSDLDEFKDKGVHVALYNDPVKVVMAGPRGQLREVERKLKSRGVKVYHVRGAYVPFHTPYMDGVANFVRKELEKEDMEIADIPIACISSKFLVIDPDHIREEVVNSINNPVQWVGAMTRLVELGIERYIILGAYDPRPRNGKEPQGLKGTIKKLISKQHQVLEAYNQASLDALVEQLSCGIIS